MKIVVMVEGKTEDVFKGYLLSFLKSRFPVGIPMPKISFDRYDGRIPKEGRLQRRVGLYLNDHRDPADHVIALTDVYTGTGDFQNAVDAKNKMIAWVGENSQFHPHVALHDFEAWLLPFWNEIKDKDLLVSANACPELKAFLNTLLRLAGGELIP